ncbi:hypothetical protein VHUM_04351 [Vanrija humicola]|uniref:alpha-amylase n=1 Tax=Vanrija humicola TaxID=5417 RepID=A0A7D8V252_VANHU|nr:hypothetical protein VHUM_04351 [Vanrija humicola]
MRFSSAAALLAAAASLHGVNAATADDWKSRNIYQLLTDRFAPPSDTAPARTNPVPETCDPVAQTWCGGTWLSIIDKLDYLQGMGVDAIWISPVHQNIDVHTPYNYAYHGYWVNDVTKLNPRFGSEQDLQTLISELHKRDMYIMVDIAINSIPTLNQNDALSSESLAADNSMWTDPAYFHKQCWIDYSNQTSCEICWFGDANLPLMDVNTEHPYVISTLNTWIKDFVTKYNIDGLRLDAGKHIPPEFWSGFTQSAGVFTIGEVYDGSWNFTASYQNGGHMDSVLGFPMNGAISKAFSIKPKNSNMTDLGVAVGQQLSSYNNPRVIGNFLENHDMTRFRNVTADPILAYNAMVAQFLFEGIPVTYYGQEQDLANGHDDPYNRAALWPTNYENGTTYQRIARLNLIRKQLITTGLQFNGKSYMDDNSTAIGVTPTDIAFRKGPIVYTLNNRGSPSETEAFGILATGWPSQTALVDLLSCHQFITGSGGSLSISYAQDGYGGLPYIFATASDAKTLGICGKPTPVGVLAPNSTSAADISSPMSVGLMGAAALLTASLF